MGTVSEEARSSGQAARASSAGQADKQRGQRTSSAGQADKQRGQRASRAGKRASSARTHRAVGRLGVERVLDHLADHGEPDGRRALPLADHGVRPRAALAAPSRIGGAHKHGPLPAQRAWLSVHSREARDKQGCERTEGYRPRPWPTRNAPPCTRRERPRCSARSA